MGKFDGMLICTDLDGTLLGSDRKISAENIRAIEYFKSEGGFFTFVTGRMPFFVSYIAENINPNAPFGCINGGGLYDWNKKHYIKKTEMPQKVSGLVRFVYETFPHIGIQINTFDKVLFRRDNRAMADFRKSTQVENLVCYGEDVGEPIAKIVFGIDEEKDVETLANALNTHPLADGFEFIQSEKTLYEILPKGTNKGAAITNLCQYLNVDVHKTIALGDYYNDIPMFEKAGVGVAVANGCADAVEAADYVTVSNDENAVSKIISDIECGKLKF